MKLSLKWLESYFENKPDWNVVLDRLTMAGIEVEGIETTDIDKIVDLKITPNRGDCLSICGVVREIHALLPDYVLNSNNSLGDDYHIDKYIDKQFQSTRSIDIEVCADNYCSQYISLVIEDVNNNVVLPAFIIERLSASGLRSVSPIVDITNYVMLELGQPLHAFDLDCVGGKLFIRELICDDLCNENVKNFKLLNGTVTELLPSTLVICDYKNNPVALAGIMGGEDSSVKSDTVNIVLESAIFSPEVISKFARKYGVISDAAYRFERSIDPQVTLKAINYAAFLIQKYCGGRVGIPNSVVSQKYFPRTIDISLAQINKYLGFDIDSCIIFEILNRIGFKISAVIAGVITVIVPSYRPDIAIKEDIVEEIARVYGYDNIPAIMPVATHAMVLPQREQKQLHQFKSLLVGLKYNEIISYAFVEEKYNELFAVLADTNLESSVVKLQNPIANWNVMRNSLFVGLIKTLQYNINRGVKSVRIFEVGKVFYDVTESSQPLKIAGLVFGNYYQKVNFLNTKREVDFFDIKHEIQILLSGFNGVRFESERNYSTMHPGRCATIWIHDLLIGVVGQLHPQIAREFDFEQLPYLFELDFNMILSSSSLQSGSTTFKVIAPCKFPKVDRDLAFIVTNDINASAIINEIKNKSIPDLYDVSIFDVYQGTSLPNNTKSVAINFTFQANRTLTESEINAKLDLVKSIMLESFNAKLRY